MEKSIFTDYEGPVEAECQRRHLMWEKLKEAGGPNRVSAGLLRDLGIFGGGQGIWVDKSITGPASPDGNGATVSLLLTGEAYGDDLSTDGVMYHYRRTARPLGRDLNEINATRNAGLLGLPVFVITAIGPGKSLRDVQIGWVEDWSDAIGAFLVVFGDIEEPIACVAHDPGRLFASTEQLGNLTRQTHKRSTAEARFRFGVFKRYGYRCAVCGIAVPELLDVVNTKPKGSKAESNAMDGLVMCSLHRRAYEAGLFTIDPDTLHVITPAKGPDAAALKIIYTDLRYLSEAPLLQCIHDVENWH